MTKRCFGIGAALFLGTLQLGAFGCRKEGPAERAGRQLDQATKSAGQKLDKAGQKIDNAVRELKK